MKTIFFGISLVLGLVASSEAANPLQSEMKELKRSSAFVQSVARRGMKDPGSVSAVDLDSAIARFPEIRDSIQKVRQMKPDSMTEAEVPAALLANYQNRILALGKLFEILASEFESLRGKAIEERNFSRAGAISARIDQCRNRSHDDFMSPPAPVDSLDSSICDFVQ